MDMLAVGIVSGVAVLGIGFLGNSARNHLRRGRERRRILGALRAELNLNIDRLDRFKSPSSLERHPDGTQRVVYHSGAAYADVLAPALPSVRTAILEDLLTEGKPHLADQPGPVGDALVAPKRYQKIDADRFRDAWYGAMHPLIMHMVPNDPNSRTNHDNAQYIITTDRTISAARSALISLRKSLDTS